MAYVIAAVIVVLLVAGFVAFIVTNAANKSGPAASGSDEGPPGIGADDSTPLGDTTEHAEERTPPPTVVGRHETDDPDDAAHFARPGEGEGGERLEFEAEHPARERDQH
jgi:hypothetical protein